VQGALAPDVSTAVLSIGRGNAKTALSAGLALGDMLGIWDDQPSREAIIAARTRDQGRIAWNFCQGFVRGLPEDIQKRITFRQSPRLEIEFDDGQGPSIIRAIGADGKTALGGAPTLALLDERGHWQADKGDTLEHALLSGLGKRGGRALIISTSAPNDAHPFSKWLDHEQAGVFRQEHRPAPGLPADDLSSLREANPGADFGIGSTMEWLTIQARRAISRGGSALNAFRLYNRNERVSDENRDSLLTVDEWQACETDTLPPREGNVVVGIDLGGSSSMSAAAFYWPKTNRLEVLGTFPGTPGLLDRGERDGVSDRYLEMHRRGELNTLGGATVPIAAWLQQVVKHVEDQTIGALVADRFKYAEVSEGLAGAGVRVPMTWRGQGFRDGGEDIERFRRAAFDGKIKSLPSLLVRSAMADAVCLRDPANNMKLAKGRSLGRIDPVAAAVLAVAQGARITAQPIKQMRQAIWA
jgi:phage terminase large subunit-like protein